MKDPEQLKEAIESLGGEFELIRELGQGATAVVYLLRDHALDRDVAMKVIRATFAGDDEAIARLQREARLVAQLTHPNIVKLYGTHRLTDGSFALFMEHVPGRNLKELLREEGAFPVPKALRVLKDVASALAYAHRRRIVHRDVKPENIYIDEEVGAARLADFGVARPWDQDARLTLPGASLGTPAYMSPEQIDGQEVDGRSDVYSLGLVGYELLLGHHPWEGENVFTIIYRQKNDELPIQALGLGDYPALADTLKQALEKNPAHRLDSAVTFLERLSEVDGSQVFLAPGERGASDSLRLDDGLSPVDWDTVEVSRDEAGPVPARVPGSQTENEDGEDSPLLGVRPGNPLRRWGLPLAGIIAVASFGVFKWQPWDRPTVDPGAFIPITAPPVTTGAPAPASNDGAPVAPVGLHATQDSLLTGMVGTDVQLSVQAADSDGNPMFDTLVVFRVTEGTGILETEEVRTDPDGIAQAIVRLPNRAGTVSVLAYIAGADTLETRFSLAALPGLPQRVVSIVGNGQSARIGEALSESLGVRVLDEFGNSVSGVEVRFQVFQGGGQIGPPASPTDEEGQAFARWTLGSAGGTQLVAAVVPGADDALLTFQATAIAPPVPEPVPVAPPSEANPTPGNPETGPVTVISKTFAVGGSQVCHLVGGTAICRGTNDRGQGGRSFPFRPGRVGCRDLPRLWAGCHGRAFCWGSNDSGQLGDGSTTDRRPAGAVDTEARFLRPGGRSLPHLWPWCRRAGQLLGSKRKRSAWNRNPEARPTRPVAVSGDASFQDLIAGWNHTCGLRSGEGFCWGANSAGQIGDGSQVDRLVPTSVPGSFQAHRCRSGSHLRHQWIGGPLLGGQRLRPTGRRDH